MASLCRCTLIFIFMSCSWALGFSSKVNAFRSEERQVLSEICCSEDQGLETQIWGPLWGEGKCHSLLRSRVQGGALCWKAGVPPHPASREWRLHVAIAVVPSFGTGHREIGSFFRAPAHGKPHRTRSSGPSVSRSTRDPPPYCAGGVILNTQMGLKLNLHVQGHAWLLPSPFLPTWRGSS